jgi:hypothetical protein
MAQQPALNNCRMLIGYILEECLVNDHSLFKHLPGHEGRQFRETLILTMGKVLETGERIKKMRAIVAEEFGGYQNLKLPDVPKPAMSDGRVLVRMTAAGLNPLDYTTAVTFSKGVPPCLVQSLQFSAPHHAADPVL